MQSKPKSKWGEPRDWVLAVGALILVIGVLRLISGVWTPDAAASAGAGNTTAAIIMIVIGLVVAAGAFVIKHKA
jgi:hypothetical protein